MAIKFKKQLEHATLLSDSVMARVVPTYNQIVRWGREDIEAVVTVLREASRQEATQFIAQFLAQLDITKYSKEFYRTTYNYVRDVLLANYLYAFASSVQDLLETELEKHRTVVDVEELVLVLRYVCEVLAEENDDVSSNFTAPSILRLQSVLSSFYNSMAKHLSEGSIPTYVFKLFLISPKFVTTSDDTVFTLAYNDTIGYSGRTRIIGVVEFPHARDLELSQIKGSEMCAQSNQNEGDPARKWQASMLVPVARVYRGTGSGFVRSAIAESAKLLRGRSSNIPVCSVIGSAGGKPQLAATFSDGYLYGKVPVDRVCRWASIL